MIYKYTVMNVSYIYIIGGDSPPYKVGISKNPKKRLKSLQTGSPYPLTIHSLTETCITKTKLLETVIHRHLKHYRTNGEWFNVPLEDLKLEIDFAIIRYGDDPILRSLVKHNMI